MASCHADLAWATVKGNWVQTVIGNWVSVTYN